MMAKAAKFERIAGKQKGSIPLKRKDSRKAMMSKIRQTVKDSSDRLLPPNFSDTVDIGGGTMKVIARDDDDQDYKKRGDRGAQMIDLPGVRKNATQRLAEKALQDSKKVKALGDISEMHRQILLWDFPPTTRSVIPPHFEKDTLLSIPKVFKTSREYSTVFEPLLILEVWAQFCQSGEEFNAEANDALVGKLDSVLAIDEFYELSFSADGRSARKIQDQDLVQLCEVRINGLSFDCLLLSTDPKMKAGSKPIVAKINRVTCKHDQGKIVARIFPSNKRTDIISRLRPGSKWRFSRILSLVTIHREYTAMLNMPLIPLRYTV